jgi:putative membrane protein
VAGADQLRASIDEVLAVTYLWFKAGHVIFVIFWMAGLFMLPRYFVYHQECAPDAPENTLWVERERRLLRIILWPAMAVTWLLGVSLALMIGAFGAPWFRLKLAFVLVLSAYHVWLSGYHTQLAQGERRLNGRQLRILNEVPGMAAAVIVIMVILKPF